MSPAPPFFVLVALIDAAAVATRDLLAANLPGGAAVDAGMIWTPTRLAT
jgi:hypothetical protein